MGYWIAILLVLSLVALLWKPWRATLQAYRENRRPMEPYLGEIIGYETIDQANMRRWFDRDRIS